MADNQAVAPDFQLPDEPVPEFVLPGEETRAEKEAVRDVPPKEVPVGSIFGGEGGMAPPSTETMKTKGYEDYPTFAEFDPSGLPSQKSFDPIRNAKLLFGYSFANGPQERADIIQKNIPEAEFSEDKYGNPLVSFDGKKYHIDKPTTMNWQNVGNVAAQTAAGAPLAAAVAAAPVGIPTAIALQGLAGAGTSVLGDIAANLSGADQKVDYGKASIQGLIGAGGSALAGGLSKFTGPIADELSGVPSAVKKLFVKSAPETGVPQMAAEAHPASDMMLHDPSFQGFAAKVMANEPQSPAAKTIEDALVNHSAQAPVRIGSDINQAFGPAGQSERAAAQALLTAKKGLSPQLDSVLAGAGPVDPSGVVAQIDNAMKTAPAGSPTQNFLRKARGMLVEQEGTPGVPTKLDPQTGLPLIGTGSPGKPPVYYTDPRTLENARLSLDRIIKFGDSGINPNAISPQDYAATNVRTALSAALKKQIPGYEDLMGKYSNIYSMLDANEQGANIFGKGINSLRPDQVAAMAADPVTGPSFRAGARAAVANKLATSPDDIKALKAMVGGPGDYTRENIETLFGPKATDIVQTAAQREANSNAVANSLLSAKRAGEQSAGAKIYERSTAPLSAHPIQQAYGQIVQNPVNSLIDWARGRTGDAYSKGIGDFLTMPRNQGIKGLQSALHGQAAARAANKLSVPALSVTEGASNVGQPIEQRHTGGRTGRATGGAVNLMALSKAAKNYVTQSTEGLLNESDDNVAHALEIANRHV